MNKEEQQQNLYRLLLQRNQYNFDAIRKFRRKSNQYLKRERAQLSATANCTHEADGVKGDTIPNCTEGKRDPLGVDVEGKADGMAQGEASNADGKQEKENKQELKLPAINSTVNNTSSKGEEGRDKICSTRRNLGMRTEVSMSVGGLAVENKTKTTTEISQNPLQQQLIKQAPTVATTSISFPEPKSSKPPSKPHNLASSIANPIPAVQVARREAHISTSHKALLNLQEIVFEANGSNRRGHSNNNKWRDEGVEEEGRESKKMRKYREKVKAREKIDDKENAIEVYYNFNNGYEGRRLTSLEGLKSLTNVVVQQASKNGSNGHISSISLTALTCLNNAMAQRTAATNPNPKMPQQPHFLSVQPQKPSPKPAQILPHIRKLKQLRFNLHKISRKEPSTNNSTHGHNHSYSLTGMNVGSGAQAEGLADYELASRVFRIEAVPVQQIKWM